MREEEVKLQTYDRYAALRVWVEKINARPRKFNATFEVIIIIVQRLKK
jgi:hypothetical protein